MRVSVFCVRPGGQLVRVWRALRASVAPGESRREKEPKPAAAAIGGDGGGSEPGLRDEAPACPQLPGTAGELIGHHRSSGLATPGRNAALGGPAPVLPARPRRAPGKEFARLAPGLSERVAGSGADPLHPEHLGGSKRRTTRRAGRRSHYWSSPLPLPIPSLPLGGGKGRTRKKKKKKEKGGGVGELDIKIGWGGWWKIFGLLSSGFSCGGGGGGSGSKRRKGSPSYDCRMLIAPAWVRGLQPETQPDSEVVQLCPGRDI